jgi:hypothetical protein
VWGNRGEVQKQTQVSAAQYHDIYARAEKGASTYILIYFLCRFLLTDHERKYDETYP